MIGKIVDSINNWKLEREFNKFVKEVEIERKKKQEVCEHEYSLVDTYEIMEGFWELYEYHDVYVIKCYKCKKVERSKDRGYIKSQLSS